MIQELKQFVGLKKNDMVCEGHMEFHMRDNIVVCVLNVDIIIGSLYPGIFSDVILREKLVKRFPEFTKNRNPWLEATIVGKAVCSENDTFDEKLGKTIAYSKAQKKAYSIASRVALFISQHLEIKSAEICRMGHFLKMAADREENFVKSI